MRLKNYLAASMTEAMNQVKEELGSDAIIISAETVDGQFKVVAALEEREDIDFNAADELKITPSRFRFDDSHLRDCLDYHGVIDTVAERILAYCRNLSFERGISDEHRLLSACFAEMFAFGSLLDLNCPVKMFMGVPGSGKSTIIAKVATQARFNKIRCCIISTDNVRAGANHQLEAFAKILETDFFFCKGGRSLFDAVRSARQNYQLVLIDTPGVNPFIAAEIERLRSLAEVVKCEMVMTVDAGKNSFEAVEIAEIFNQFGIKYLLPTRLDLTRRIGSLISIAGCCRIGFCAASVSSGIAQGLASVNHKSLAKLILS